MKRRSDNDGLGDDIVLELLPLVPGRVVHTQDPVAAPDRDVFAHVGADERIQLPGEVRAGSESADVSFDS